MRKFWDIKDELPSIIILAYINIILTFGFLFFHKGWVGMKAEKIYKTPIIEDISKIDFDLYIEDEDRDDFVHPYNEFPHIKSDFKIHLCEVT